MAPQKGQVWKAMYAHLEAEGKEELAFDIGDLFTLLKTPKDESESWWYVQSNQGRKLKGYAPANCLAAEDSLDHYEWCHGAINRSAAEFLLVKAGTNGGYLVRESQSKPGEYTLSLYDDAVAHYRINQQADGRCFIRAKQLFNSIPALIDHHKGSTSGLPVVLSMVIPKMHAKAVVIAKHLEEAWELPRKDIKLGKMLGAGNYGEVYKAVWTSTSKDKGKMTVAVKTVKEDSMGIEEFMREAQVMKQMKHPNLVLLLGVCSAELPMYIVTEMVPHGDLLSYLRKQTSAKEINTKAKLYIASQVADGMQYLENKNVIHRDLAARNCLVADDLMIKIADFGMGRVIDDLYTAKTGSKMPVKWSAPESLCYNAFSSASDVWSFGILLWEVVTLGNNPYPEVESKDVLTKLEVGYRMPEPQNCPTGMYTEMYNCWMMRAEDRPSFKTLAVNLDKLLDAKVGSQERSRKESRAAKPPPTTSWKDSYESQGPGMSQTSLQQLIDDTKEGYGLASNIVRYGDQSIVKDQVKKLIAVMSRLFDGIQPLTKEHSGLKTCMKSMMQNITPIQKMASAPKLEKVQPFVEKIRNLIREMNKHLKSLKGK